MAGLAHNDETGKVFCHLCEWTLQCVGMERIEFAVQKHLREAHGLPTWWRTEKETGKRTDIPQ